MILKKSWFSDAEMREKWELINPEEYEEDPPVRSERQNSVKMDPPNRTEAQNTDWCNTTHPNTIKHIITEDNSNIKLIKTTITEKKSTLSSLWNQDWINVTVENQKVNKLLFNIPEQNITELNELIYGGAKRFCDESPVPLKNPKKKLKKLGWEIRLEEWLKNMQ